MFYSTLMVAFRDLQVMINPLALTLLTKKRRMGDDGLLFANKNLSGLSQEVTLIIILIILQSCWTRVDQTFAKFSGVAGLTFSWFFLKIQYFLGLRFFSNSFMKLRKKLIDQMKKIWPTLPGIILLLLIKSCDKQDFCRKRVA